MNLAQIRQWRPEVVADVADALAARRSELLVADEAPGAPKVAFAAELQTVIAALNVATDTIRHLVEEVEATRDYALGHGCRVDLDTGLVTASTPAATSVRNSAIARFEHLSAEAIGADADLAAALDRAAQMRI
ncbi:MAG TPA: hypothetical protein VK095_04780 [Beutenbergiaceae bacterium]|nr:hypothetical protein [Beutenbergiaceae bacterium]